MISSLIPYAVKVIFYSIPLCALVWLYNWIFAGSIDVLWGVVAAVILSPMGSKTETSEDKESE